MKKILKIITFLIIFLMIPLNVSAEGRKINIHLFYGEGCPHCAHEMEFLSEYLKDNDNVELFTYEVWYDRHNQELLAEVQKQMGTSSSGIPYTVIGKKVISGYSDSVQSTIKDTVEYYLNEENSYKDYAGEITGYTNRARNQITEPIDGSDPGEDNNINEEVTVPVLGKINAKSVSLPLLSVVLGFVDGFNPCAMWILIFLITMLFNMKDRKKMWILGLTFILTSGIVYLAFMLAWLNLATFISKISFIRLLVAFVAIIVGIINVSKYISSMNKKDEGCDVVTKNDRKKIINKIKSITTEKKFAAAIIGIIVLAASVNIIELMCSIGIPLLFTQILAMNDLSNVSYIIYMLIYILFFLIDDIVVFIISMVTLKVTGLSTKYTKYSHLIGGIIMLLIGVLLIVKPEILMFNF